MTTPSSAATILVVDDEPDLRTLYELTLLREGYRVDTAGDLAQARCLLMERQYAVLITDMRLPDGLGLSLISDLKDQQRREQCVVITAYGSAENAVEALKSGAFDYLTKPVDLKQFRHVISSAIHTQSKALLHPQPSATEIRDDVSGQRALNRLIGASPGMQMIRERVVKVASSMAPVLITGESGTGKELVAHAIHANSHRAKGPWVAVNCSAIPDVLLEAEFFGVKKGAYTGAHADREGFFQAASGGTLFLDEIGDLPLTMQSKLLRAIQERRVRPLGSTQEDMIDARILSATHKDLAHEVLNGHFRQDLFYRLNVIDIVLPPLRQRTQDLPDLCQALLRRIADESGLPVPSIRAQDIEKLSKLPLAGNVRELENLLHRAVALGNSNALQFDVPAVLPTRAVPDQALMASMPENTSQQGSVCTGLQHDLDELERRILNQALHKNEFNLTAAAQQLGLTMRQLKGRLTRLHISTLAHI